MRFVKNYMNDSSLRHELNALTQETFGFDFESWVTGGYDRGDYIPYSYEENGRMISNVSVNRMEFVQNGQEKNYIQIGTVMTKKEFRNQGYARKLMEKVLSDYTGKCDGIYLFGNLSALEFYDKMGFSRGMQYQYTLKENAKIDIRKEAGGQKAEDCFKPVNPNEQALKERYIEAVQKSVVNAALDQKNRFGLQMFYTAGMEGVYYSRALDCYIVMEKQGGVLYLQSVICTKKVSLKDVLRLVAEEYDSIVLGFAPCVEDSHLFEAQPYDGEEDYRLFIMGEDLKRIEIEKLYFPEFSHA